MKCIPLTIVFAAALGAGVPESAFSAPSQAPSPKWARVPSADDVANYYPQAASRAEIGGQAVLNCRLDAAGVPRECQVAQETPEGYGFGTAALRLSRLFKAALRADGKSSAGMPVRIPITFREP